MVVSRRAAEGFFDRPLADSDKAKVFSLEAIDRKLAALRPVPRFHTKPRKHQKLCFLLGLKYGSYFLMLDMGLGKSKICLDLIAYRQAQGLLRKRTLVLVPWRSMVSQWLDEVRIHTPYLKARGLTGSRADREEILCDTVGHDILVMTYQGYLALVCGKAPAKGFVFDEKTAKVIEDQFGFVVFDESTALRNHDTLTYRAARRLSKTVDFRVCLSGTPFDKHPEELWSQFYVIDHGDTLGPTLGLFRAAFCKEKESVWSPWPEYVFNNKLEEALYRTIRHRSIRFKIDECEDLPPIVGGIEARKGPIVRSVPMTKEARRYYDGVIEEIKTADQNYKLVESAYLRMRQIASGYMTLKGEDDSRLVSRFQDNPKLTALGEILAEIPKDSKVIVFTFFHATGDIVAEYLKAQKLPFVRLYGKTTNKAEVLDSFKRDPKVKILLGSTAIAFGQNLQMANYTVFYESPDSVINRKQMERRTWRMGQTKRTFIYDLITEGSIEKKILDVLVEGKDMHDVLLDGLKEV